jgi:hypothetical protein
MPDYPFVVELVRHGWDIEKAREISEEMGYELWEHKRHVAKQDVEDLNFLTRDEKSKLWALLSGQRSDTRGLHALLAELTKE